MERHDTMERVTLRIPKKQVEKVEELVEEGEFPNRSAAIRSATRDMLKRNGKLGDRAGHRHPWERDHR